MESEEEDMDVGGHGVVDLDTNDNDNDDLDKMPLSIRLNVLRAQTSMPMRVVSRRQGRWSCSNPAWRRSIIHSLGQKLSRW